MPSSKTPAKQGSDENVGTLIRMLMDMETRRQGEEEKRRTEENERFERRREEEEKRRIEEAERFERLLMTLRSPSVDSTTGTPSVSNPLPRPSSRALPSQPPPTLSLDITVGAFRRWRLQWKDYVTLIHFGEFTAVEQAAILRRALNQDVRDVVDQLQVNPREVGETTTVEDYLDALETYFEDKRDLGREREAFERREQQPGELFDHFYIALRNLGKDADLCDHCIDQRIADRIRVGLYDDDIRRRLMAIRPYPELEEVVAFCRREEAGRKFSTQHASVQKVNLEHNINHRRSPSRHEHGHNKDRAHRSQSRKNNQRFQQECNKCGHRSHFHGQSCPATNAICAACKEAGHYAKRCPTKGQNHRNSGIAPKIIPFVKVGNVSSPALVEATPKTTVSLLVKGTVTKVTIDAIPDSGSPCNIMSESLFVNLGLNKHNLKPLNLALVSCEREPLQLSGYLNCQIQVGEITCDTKIVISKRTDGFLLGWKTCQDLKILHECFPLQINAIESDRTKDEIKYLIENLPEKPTVEEITAIKEQVVALFPDVFDKTGKLKAMAGTPMKIHIKPGATPFALSTARQIPIPLREKVRNKILDMCEQGIIEQVGDVVTEWCSPMVVCHKPNGDIRICTDFTRLNQHCARPFHPQQTPKDAIDSVRPGDNFFSVLDARNGYWQMEIDKDSQLLTTFITPEGRFKYLRAPMGLISTGDEYNRRGDQIFSGIENMEKIVDDLLIHTKTFQEHMKCLLEILEKCRVNHITLNPDKFQFVKDSVVFGGYRITPNGTEADPEKVKAITKFPIPKNLTELRSFFGLINHLGQFSTEISEVAEPLRPLLRKNSAFIWSPNHTTAFEAVKRALSTPPVLQPFDPQLPTELHTDASRNGGLGFVLIQRTPDGKSHLIQCGSRFLSETEKRYAMVELEMQGIVWAVKKCRTYLLGMKHFKLMVDHKPLVPILNDKLMDNIENPRIGRMKEKLMKYVFNAEWRRGKDHVVPDAFSRAPVDFPSEEDIEDVGDMEELVCAHIRNLVSELDSQRSLNDPLLENLSACAATDQDYQALIDFVKQGCPIERKVTHPIFQQFYKMRYELSVDNGLILYQARIVVPNALRKQILQRLHESHQGIARTKKRARQTVFWPGISSDIKNTVDACEACQTTRPSLPPEPKLRDPLPERPFQEVAADFFAYAGKHYLAYVDRFSGWIEIANFNNRDPTTSSLIKVLRKLFSTLGVPVKFRSDGGPQFSSLEFSSFLKNWGVKHAKSAPYYPQSNGLAESAVKTAKHLVTTATRNGCLDIDEFHRGLLELRNTPGQKGVSPAQLLFGRPMRSCVPTHRLAFHQRWQEIALDLDTHDKFEDVPIGRPLRPLKVGDEVWIQNQSSSKWDTSGLIVGASGRNYHIRTPSGSVYWRNRRHLRKKYSPGKEKQVRFSEIVEIHNLPVGEE